MNRREQSRIARIGTQQPRRHPPGSPRGARYDSASATCSGATGRPLRRAPRSCAPRAPRASVHGPTAAAARRRGRAAPTPPPPAAPARRRRRRRAASTRSRTAAEVSPGGAASSAARGRGIATTRSKRSSSARDTFSWYEPIRCAEQRHSAAGSPRPPHGHMFIVRDEPKAAGKRACTADPRDRDDAVLERLPQRLEHRAAGTPAARRGEGRRGARGSPRPGRGTAPPPTIAAADAPWCGARNGGQHDERPPGRQHARHRVDACHLERLVAAQRRQDARQAAAEHRLAGAGRARRGARCAGRPRRARAPAGRAPDRGRRRDRAGR